MLFISVNLTAIYKLQNFRDPEIVVPQIFGITLNGSRCLNGHNIWQSVMPLSKYMANGSKAMAKRCQYICGRYMYVCMSTEKYADNCVEPQHASEIEINELR